MRAVALRQARRATYNAPAARSFWSWFEGKSSGPGTDNKVPLEHSVAVGARAKELGGTQHMRDPIVPPAGAGTFENPIQVPTKMSERVAGFEDPGNHAIYWFNMTRGETFYVQRIDKYFKLVDEEEYVKAAAASA